VDSKVTSIRFPSELLAEVHELAGERGSNHFVVEAVKVAVCRCRRAAVTKAQLRRERDDAGTPVATA